MKHSAFLMALFTCCAICDDTGSTLKQKEADELVAFHNKARKEVGSPPVKWSNTIAKFAQEWADEIAKTGDVKHRPGDGVFAQKYGECWATWSAGNASIMIPAKMWYDEKKLYKPGAAIDADLNKYGHYTQLVWKETKEIGCGKAIIRAGPKKGWLIVVCNYDPTGNAFGAKPY